MQYRFGEFTLDTDALELRTGDRAVELQPQVFAVLAHLVEHRHRVVTKEELLDAVWASQFVSESALSTRIKEARQAIGDDGREQRMIKTAHGRGYRFAGRVETTEPPGAEAPAATQPAPVPIDAVPRTRYADSDGLSIAYQVFGDGPPLLFVAGFTTNVEVMWEYPAIAAFFQRLASFARVVVFDKRGTGLSDRIGADTPLALEHRAHDVEAVLDAAAVERTTILGSSEGGALSMLFAAARPDRAERLILHSTWVHHPLAADPPVLDAVEQSWGTGDVYSVLADQMGATPEGRRFLARYERQSATPRAARRLVELLGQIEIAGVLPAIAVPTLVLHRADDNVAGFEHAEQVAAGIAGAELLRFPGRDHYLLSGDTGPMLDAIQAFVTGTAPAPVTSERVLATVLRVEIVDAATRARRLGERRWAQMLDDFAQAAQQSLAAGRGELVEHTGDGLLAVFDGPGHAVKAARALGGTLGGLGLEVRAGVHTAEIERHDGGIAGIGVQLADGVARAAQPGRVWVSRTVRDLVAGCDLVFEARGEHLLEGIDEHWTLYEAVA